MLVIGLIASVDFGLGYLLLVPAIADISFQLCSCNNTARGCDITDPAILCYPAVFLFYVVIFLSSLMLSAILWVRPVLPKRRGLCGSRGGDGGHRGPAAPGGNGLRAEGPSETVDCGPEGCA